MAKLKVSLEIEVGDMSEEQLRDAGWFSLMEDEFSGKSDEDDDADDEVEAETPPVALDYEAREIASLIPSAIGHPDAELFAGSDIFVTLGEIRVSSAEWSV